MEKLIDEYINKSSWRSNANANWNYSFSGLQSSIAGTALAKDAILKYGKVGKRHLDGTYHIHNLEAGVYGRYCNGNDTLGLLQKGLYNPSGVSSKPARHFSTALDHIVNMTYIMTGEFAGAQAWRDIDILLAPFVANDHLSYDSVKQEIQEMIWSFSYPMRPNFQCVSEDTKILTLVGWKNYNELTYEDFVGTFNLKNNYIEFLKPEKIVQYDYNGKLIHIYNNRTDQLVTPNHRVITTKTVNNNQDWIFTEASDLLNRKVFCVPLIGKNKNEEYPITDEELKLHAWILSEGSIISISKQIPQEFLNLSKRQARLFINEFRKGDGCKQRFRLYQKDNREFEMLEALCILSEYGFNSRTRENGIHDISVIQDFNNKTYIHDIKEVDYNGCVWCVHTKNETMITKRNNKIAITGNTPFVNLTFGLKPSNYYKNLVPVIGDERLDSTYSDYQDEIDMINKAFLDIMIKGPGDNKPFTFPLPTYNITKNFDWNSEVADKIFELASEWGTPYFANYINSTMNEEDALSMCCRLRINLKEVQRVSGGIWNFGANTGSLAVFTVNMSRIGYLSNSNEAKFYKILDTTLEDGKKYLIQKKKCIVEGTRLGLFPMTNAYVGKKLHKTYFLTIGINGLNECSMNFCGADIIDNKHWCEEVLAYIAAKVLLFQQQTGELFNFEATPGEGCSYSLARIDKEKFPDIFTQGEGDEIYYTGSSLIPAKMEISVEDALAHQEKLQRHYTGGTVFHIDEGISNYPPKSIKNYIKRVCTDYALPYITWSPSYCVCPVHGKGNGKGCCDKAEVYSRVVGYYRPVERWNIGKKIEFKEKKFYTNKIEDIKELPYHLDENDNVVMDDEWIPDAKTFEN